MKKLLICFTTILLLTTGCTNENKMSSKQEDILTLYNTSLDDFNNLESYESNYISNIIVSTEATAPESSEFTFDYKEIRLDDGDHIALLSENIDFESTTYTSNSLYKDGMVYYYGFSEPQKVEMDFDSFRTQYAHTGLIEFNEDDTILEVTKSDQNLITFKIDSSSGAANELMSYDANYLVSNLGASDIEYTYDFSPLTYTAALDSDNQIFKTTLEYSISFSVPNDANKLTFDFTLSKYIDNVNNVNINIPEDIDTYEQITG